MADVSPTAVAEARRALGVPLERIPRSIAIIMDGNGRWAVRRGLPRSAGHEQGAKVVPRIVTEAARLGMEALTLYSFSLENWRRPPQEVAVLMHLYAEYLVQIRPGMMEHNIRLRHLGRREGLPQRVLRELDKSRRLSAANTGMELCLALNYGSRAEITDAMVRIARRVGAGELTPEDIDESLISDSLATAGVSDPDLVIRTAGEMRLSNFLLWQISYAEYYCCRKYWPDFDEEEFRKAIRTYARRHRRFGGVDTSNAPAL
jgi:undecaprenyl diphosphate synthase